MNFVDMRGTLGPDNEKLRRLARFVRAALVVIAALFLLAPPSTSANADGPGDGGRRVIFQAEPAGPYVLRVVTSPIPPRVGELYVEVRVADPQSGDVLSDVDVHMRAEPTATDAPSVEAEATHELASIPNEYAAHLPVDAAGVWRVTIEVQGPDGRGELSFLTRVGGSGTLGAALSVGLPFAGFALLLVLLIWLQRNSEQQDASAEA